jgi:hypothetical protein
VSDKLKEIAERYGWSEKDITPSDELAAVLAALREAYALGLEEAAQVAKSMKFSPSVAGPTAQSIIVERIRQLATRKEQG